MAFVDGPQRKEADKALRIAHIILLDVLAVQDEHFDIPELKTQNQICSKDFMAIWYPNAVSPPSSGPADNVATGNQEWSS